MGDHSCAVFQILFQVRTQQLVGVGGQVEGNNVSGAQVDIQEIPVDHLCVIIQTQPANARVGAIYQIVRNLNAHGFGLEPANGGEQNAPVAAAQIVEFLAGLQIGQLQHAIDDFLGRNNVRRQTVGVMLDVLLAV